MGATSGTQNSPLVAADLQARLWQEPYAFEFFQAVRLLENILSGRKEVGRFSAPNDEIVRFRQNTSLSFPSADILGLDFQYDGPPQMTVSFMGLLGVQGVLPRAYTELAIKRAAARDPVLREFLDIFHHRFVSLFYLAWRKYRILERSSEYPNAVEQALFHLMGLGTRGIQNRLSVPDANLLFYTGLLTQQPRSAAALEALLRDYFEVPVRIEQFVGAWYKLDPDAFCSLDDFGLEARQLGVGSVIGDEVWEPQAKVRIVLGPLSRRRYSDFLPTGKNYAALRSIVRFFSDEIDFEVQLVLEARKTPPCRLGKPGECGPRLGWLSWMTTRVIDRNPADTIIPL